jgi:hypothetical protein
MVIIHPRPFLLGFADVPLTSDGQYFMKTIPQGAPWRFQFLLAGYARAVAGLVQTSCELAYTLFDADGRTFQVAPVLLPQVTTPAGGRQLRATNPIKIDYPGGTSVKIQIHRVGVGTLPPSISLTFFGIRGWEGFGRS